MMDRRNKIGCDETAEMLTWAVNQLVESFGTNATADVLKLIELAYQVMPYGELKP